MKYNFIPSAVLLTLLFAPLSGIEAKVERGGDGMVIHLHGLCQACLLHCIRHKEDSDINAISECGREVCMDLCKIEERQ